jgi:cell division septation protein DedD
MAPRRGPPAPDPPDRRGWWWVAGTAFAVVAFLVLRNGLAGSGEAPAPVLHPSPIHAPVARADTVQQAPPPAALPTERAPAPVAKPPAATPAAAPRRPRSPQWVVQVGVYRSEANANTALAKLRRIDPDAAVEERKGLHFVVSRPFGSEAEAAKFERGLEAAGLSTIVRERHAP